MVTQTVSIIDPDKDYSSIVTSLLQKNENCRYEVVGIHNDLNDLYRLKIEKPDLVLLEIAFREQTLEEIILQIKRLAPYSQVIILTSSMHQDTVIQTLRAGADGYIIKTLDCHVMIRTLDKAQNGGVCLSSDASRAIVEHFRSSSKSLLTRRESEIMNLVSSCKSYSEISQELKIGKQTARKHIRNIYRKLNVHKKSDAIRIARQEKFIAA